MREPAQGQIIAGKYRIESLIGHGGMGSVWRARHESLDMPVAIKFMGAHTAGDVEARQRFEREARALASLRTPNIVQVLDHGIDDGAPYIVMEMLEGEDLSARMASRRRLPLNEVSRILSQTARALRRAHEAGITHRDLKPSNVFLAQVDGEEVVKVLDFGVAKLAAVGALGDQLTKIGTLLGSPGYMSPEQARGKDVDFRSDLWALAVIVFRAVTGVKPFAGDSIAELVIKLCIDPRPVATRIAADLPPEVDRFFEKAFAAEPQDRFQSAVEMAAAFAQMVGAPGLELSRLGPSPISASMRANPTGASPVSTWTGSFSGSGAAPSPSSGVAAAPVGPMQTALGFPLPAAVAAPPGSAPTPRPSRPSSPPEPAQTMLLTPSPVREPTPTPASFGGFAPALAETSSVAPAAGSSAPLPEGALRPPPAFVPPSPPSGSMMSPTVSSTPFQRGPDAPDAPTPTGMRLHPPGPSVVTPPPPASPSASPKVDVKMLLFAAAGAAVLAIFFALAISGLRRRHTRTTAEDDRDDLPTPTTMVAPAIEPPATPATTTTNETTASATTEPATTTAPSTEEPAPTADPTAADPTTAPTTKATSARPWTAPTTKPTSTGTKTAPAPSTSGSAKKKPKPKPNFGY
ncbi:MAG: serine/threonine-protein kinase [Polyangiaceae bacterium]